MPGYTGSSHGSTGPRSLDPATGLADGPDFPALTVADVVAAQEKNGTNEEAAAKPIPPGESVTPRQIRRGLVQRAARSWEAAP